MIAKALGYAARLLFAVQFALIGWALRPFSITRDLLPGLLSVAFWWTVALLLTARWQRILIAAVVAFFVSLEWDYYQRYHVTLDAQALACARQNWADVRSSVVDSLRSILSRGALLLVLSALLLELGRARAKPLFRRRWVALGLACAATVAVLLPRRSAEFEIARGMTRFLRPPESVAVAAVSLPIATTPARELPSVLFILSESIRASDYCDGPTVPCPTAPRIQALLPERATFHFMRSVGSYTSIALSGLYTGVHQVRSRDEILSAPTIFDFLRATHTDDGASIPTRYLSAHLRYYLMGRELAADTVVRLEDLTGDPEGLLPKSARRGEDGLLFDRYLQEVEHATRPEFVMLHFAGTHVRYFIDPSDAPFQPWTDIVSYDQMKELRNKYKNAIYQQDKVVADAVSAFVKAQGKRPYVIFFTSDHGEAFNEHEAIHHGQSLHDEQAHVPAWIVNGNGAMSPAQWENIRAYEGKSVTHLDVLPTFLDLYGVYDALAYQPFRSRLEGRSLLRAPAPMTKAIPISNCPSWFECPIANWGVQREDHLLIANVWNAHWNCANIKTRAEWIDSDECRSLVEVSKGLYPTLPNGMPNR